MDLNPAGIKGDESAVDMVRHFSHTAALASKLC